MTRRTGLKLPHRIPVRPRIRPKSVRKPRLTDYSVRKDSAAPCHADAIIRGCPQRAFIPCARMLDLACASCLSFQESERRKPSLHEI